MEKTCFCGISENCGYQIETDMEQHDKVIYEQGYNKAIEDVMEKAREIQEEQIKNLGYSTRRHGIQWATYMGTYLGHMQVACKRLIEERLKS